jgi:hypothetical protein
MQVRRLSLTRLAQSVQTRSMVAFSRSGMDAKKSFTVSLARVGQHRQDGESPARGSSAHDGDEVPVAFLEGNLVQSQHTECFQRCPVHGLGYLSVENAFDRFRR